MEPIGYMKKVADNAVEVTLNNGSKTTYTLVSSLSGILENEIIHLVKFVGFSSNNFIVVYKTPGIKTHYYISTGEFKDEFMKEFINLLSK